MVKNILCHSETFLEGCFNLGFQNGTINLSLHLMLRLILLKEYLQMPRESIRSVVQSAEKDAVKRFLSQVHQSWEQLQVETVQVKLFICNSIISCDVAPKECNRKRLWLRM